MIAFWGSLSDAGNFSNNSIQMWTYARPVYVLGMASGDIRREPNTNPASSHFHPHAPSMGQSLERHSDVFESFFYCIHEPFGCRGFRFRRRGLSSLTLPLRCRSSKNRMGVSSGHNFLRRARICTQSRLSPSFGWSSFVLDAHVGVPKMASLCVRLLS